MTRPSAIVLGSGTSNGVPALGKQYPPHFLANPKNHRSRCSLLLRGPTGNVLVDCAPEMRLQLLRHDVQSLEAVIVTHTHADHIMGMDDLRSFCLQTGRPMPVYSGSVFHEDIRRVFQYAFQPVPEGLSAPQFELHDVAPILELAGLVIHTFWVEHGTGPYLGIRVNDFAYVTDVSRIPEDAMAQLAGVKVLVLDAVRHRPHPSHFHMAQAQEVAHQIGAEKTYFTHLCDEYDHDDFESTLPPEFRLAYDGLEIPL